MELAGDDHLPFFGDQDAVVVLTQEFLTGALPVADPDRMLATLLFTDVVDSTKLATELLTTFDGPARAIRAAQAIRTELAEHGLQIRAGLHAGEIELVGDDNGAS